MTFKNEYVLPVEQETSDFLKKARETLHVGHSKYDAWTVDRQRDIVLLYKGTGRDVESSREEWWTYLDRTDKYSVDTDLLSNVEAPAQEVAITRVFRACFSSSGEAVTDLRIIGLIKEAIQEYSRSFLFNLDHFKRCQLTLIDARTGKEI